jgi:hypothetical protein
VLGSLAVGSVIAGYRIDGILGRGGMGVVYEATQLSLGRVVALKVVTPLRSHDPGYRERFRREGMAQAAIDHAHIVTVYEAGSADDQLFIAMRMIRGETLKDALRGGALEPARTLALLAPIADALDTAHASGLVHRDVKPQNVLIGPNDHPYLADFGLTKVTGQTSLTASGQFMGTPDYTPPEVAEGRDATAASDVYAFAAVVYECLTGGPPFPRPTQAAVLYAHVHEPPPAASERRPGLPHVLDGVLDRGLAKDPAQRPASARELIDAVARAFETPDDGGATVPTPLAETYAPHTTTGKSAQRRPSPRVVGAGAVAALAAAGIAFALTAGDGEDGGGRRAAGTVVIGSTLDADATRGECSGDPELSRPRCTMLQTALPGRRVTVPFDGVVDRWRVRGAKGTMAIAILRGDDELRRVAASTSQRVASTARHEFETSLRVRKGDRIALQLAQGAHFGFARGGHPGARLARWIPELTSGRPADYTSPSDLEILYAVDVEPDG